MNECHRDDYAHVNVVIYNSLFWEDVKKRGYKAIVKEWTKTNTKIMDLDQNFDDLVENENALKLIRKAVREETKGRVRISKSAKITHYFPASIHIQDGKTRYLVQRKNKREVRIAKSHKSQIAKWGFAQKVWIEEMRDNKRMSGYLVKKIDQMSRTLAGEFTKPSQVPHAAPKGFRRLRASRNLLPKVTPNDDILMIVHQTPLSWFTEPLTERAKAEYKKPTPFVRQLSLLDIIKAQNAPPDVEINLDEIPF